jgi:hypothetical protein
MNWKPVQTYLFSDIPVVVAVAARGTGRFYPLSAVPLVAGVGCLDEVQLRRIALLR